MNPRPAFIECRLRSNGKARIRADFITAIITTYTSEHGNDHILVLRLHLGHNNFIDIKDETLESLWNKLVQALGTNPAVIGETSAAYPGHPDYKEDSISLPSPRPVKPATEEENEAAGGMLMGVKPKANGAASVKKAASV